MKEFKVRSGNFLKSSNSTSNMMYTILVVLIPFIIFSTYKNGIYPIIKGYGNLYLVFKPLIFASVASLFCIVIEYLYYYIENKQSIMHTMSTMNISNNIKAFEYIRKNTENNEAIEMIFIREYLYLIVQIMILKNNSTKEIKKFISQCYNEYNKWYKNKYIKFQPTYMRLILILIRSRIILPIRIIFKLKN